MDLIVMWKLFHCLQTQQICRLAFQKLDSSYAFQTHVCFNVFRGWENASRPSMICMDGLLTKTVVFVDVDV